MDDLQSIADHVVRLFQGSETRQDLVVHSFREEYLVKGIELLDKQRLLSIEEADVRVVGVLADVDGNP